ncbi:hypothetical protein V492_03489 [Pseudogymnoascus sp. VKM F-4246]|nr:hypothetical protein V492_03489 [Pseudogymnoascus sp. VKM F-4246]
MKLLSLVACTAAFLSSGALAFPVTAAVNCRSGPGTSFGVKKSYAKGHAVTISCQTGGTSVQGNSIWDKTSDGCYVADYYVKTGSNGYVKPKCTKVPSKPKLPGPIVDDYKYKGKCSGTDAWSYYRCQCTSFVAWRINERLGIKFHNQYKGTNWGNANTWDEAARRTGVKVDNKPVPGCIAQSNAGGYGHVAWVTKVTSKSVTIEEYNYNKKEGYGTRTVPKGNFNYIHVKV